MAVLQAKYGDSYLDLAKDGDVQLRMITQGDVDVAFGRTRANEAHSPRTY
jgi:hypothetical protein